jgi:hypothetical protein
VGRDYLSREQGALGCAPRVAACSPRALHISGDAAFEEGVAASVDLLTLIGAASSGRYHQGEGDVMDATPTVQIQLQVPVSLGDLAFPEALDRRLHTLLDKQDQGERLTEDEQVEAEALVDLAQLLTLLRLRMSPQAAAAE